MFVEAKDVSVIIKETSNGVTVTVSFFDHTSFVNGLEMFYQLENASALTIKWSEVIFL